MFCFCFRDPSGVLSWIAARGPSERRANEHADHRAEGEGGRPLRQGRRAARAGTSSLRPATTWDGSSLAEFVETLNMVYLTLSQRLAIQHERT